MFEKKHGFLTFPVYAAHEDRILCVTVTSEGCGHGTEEQLMSVFKLKQEIILRQNKTTSCRHRLMVL